MALDRLTLDASLDVQRGGVQRGGGAPRSAAAYQRGRVRVRAVRIEVMEALALRAQEEEHDQQGQEEGQCPEGRIDHAAQFAGRRQGADDVHPIRGPDVSCVWL